MERNEIKTSLQRRQRFVDPTSFRFDLVCCMDPELCFAVEIMLRVSLGAQANSQSPLSIWFTCSPVRYFKHMHSDVKYCMRGYQLGNARNTPEPRQPWGGRLSLCIISTSMASLHTQTSPGEETLQLADHLSEVLNCRIKREDIFFLSGFSFSGQVICLVLNKILSQGKRDTELGIG